jgi:hypothetical protein
MHEKIEGQGRLETVDPPEKVWLVSYRFDITRNTVRKPGIAALAVGKSGSRGTITSVDGKPIPVGTYMLHANDGPTMRVENLGDTWTLLSPN